MTNKFVSLPIRIHLVILISLLSLPFIILIIHSGIVERNEAIDRAQKESSKFVSIIASQQQSLVAGVEQLVTALSFVPAIQYRDVPATNSLLIDLMKKNPQYTNIAVMDKTGLIWGTAVAFQGQISLGDRRYFRDAVRTGKFSSGEFTIGRISGKPIMNFGYPVKDRSNQVTAVIGAAFDLEYIQRDFKKMNLPVGSSFSVQDHTGVILYKDRRSDLSGKLSEKRDAGTQVFDKMKDGPDEGTFETMGDDGTLHLFVYKKISLPNESEPYLYIRSGIPKTSATSRANAEMIKNLVIWMLVFLTGLFLAWLLGERAIVNPIRLLREASQRLAAGGGTLNVSRVVRSGELGELAHAFDNMAQALVQREAAKNAAEMALRESEGKFRDLAEKSLVGISLLQEGLVKYANEKYADMIGHSIDEMVGRMTLKDMIFSEDLPLAEDMVRRHISGDVRASQYGLRMLTRDQKIKHMEVYSCATTYQGKPAVMSSVLDVTERKRTEEEMRRLRNYLGNIVNSMPSVLVGVDGEGRVTQWNQAAEQSTGLKAGEAQGQLLEQVLPMLSREMGSVRQAIRDRTVQSQTKVPRVVKGETRYDDLTIYPLVTNGVDGAVIRIDDVTDRARIEEMMIQSEKMLSVGGLAAGMAHEINNPLGVILQATQNVLRRVSSELEANVQVAEACGTTLSAVHRYLEQREVLVFLEDIRRSGQRAAQIVENMLSFSRKPGAEGSSTDLRELLDRTVELAGSDYDLKKQYDFRQIKIVREYDPNLPPVICQASKIQQVFLNILRNGAEAMRETKASGRTPRFILRLTGEGTWVRIEIEDNGSGMDDTIRRRVFEPFFTTKTPGVGTGLGLSVSYFIITENHEGTISVESTPSEGARFIIRLPVAGREK